jgi:hypothetical protein
LLCEGYLKRKCNAERELFGLQPSLDFGCIPEVAELEAGYIKRVEGSGFKYALLIEFALPACPSLLLSNWASTLRVRGTEGVNRCARDPWGPLLRRANQRELKTDDGLPVITQDPLTITGKFDSVSFRELRRFNIR